MKIRISLAQIAIRAGRVHENLAHGLDWIAQAAGQGSAMILFPEMWTAGYDLPRRAELAEENTYALSALTAAARRHQISIGGSYLLRESDAYFNTFVWIDPSQPDPATYSKIHLFRLMHEERWLSPGDRLTTCLTPAGDAGLAICYDLRFPEMFRAYALTGARLVLLPAEWPTRRIDHWSTLLRARAIENQMFVVGVNTVGSAGEDTFGGRSALIDPWGKPLAELSTDREECITVDMDMERVEHARSKIPVFQDRRADIYGASAEGPIVLPNPNSSTSTRRESL